MGEVMDTKEAVRRVMNPIIIRQYDHPDYVLADEIMAKLAPLLDAAEGMRSAQIIPCGECCCRPNIGHVCDNCSFVLSERAYDAAITALRKEADV